MPRCTVDRWGKGTTCETKKETVGSKEIQDRLKQMQQEREKQDQQWFAPPAEPLKHTPKK